MNIKEILKIKSASNYSMSELDDIAIYGELAFSSLLEGISAIGTLLFETSCNENDQISKDTLGEIGLLINQVAMIAGAVNENMHDATEEMQKRITPPIRIVNYQKIIYMAPLVILTTLNYRYINLRVIYTKANRTPKHYMHN